MSAISADEVSDRIQEGRLPDDWTVFKPRQPLILLIFMGIAILIVFCIILLAIFGITYIILRPLYIFQILVMAVLLLVFMIGLIWWFEQRDRDVLLVLMPSGFIQYKPWHNKRKRRAKVVEYAHVETFHHQMTRAGGSIISINGKDEKQEKIFITEKYGDWVTVYRKIVQRIINDKKNVIVEDNTV